MTKTQRMATPTGSLYFPIDTFVVSNAPDTYRFMVAQGFTLRSALVWLSKKGIYARTMTRGQ